MGDRWVEVCPISELAPGSGRLVMGLFSKPIALFNVDGQFYAVNAICPHMGGPLQSGRLDGKVVSCPWHQWSFCVDNGEADHPGGHRISTYRVKLEAEKIWVGWLDQPG